MKKSIGFFTSFEALGIDHESMTKAINGEYDRPGPVEAHFEEAFLNFLEQNPDAAIFRAGNRDFTAFTLGALNREHIVEFAKNWKKYAYLPDANGQPGFHLGLTDDEVADVARRPEQYIMVDIYAKD